VEGVGRPSALAFVLPDQRPGQGGVPDPLEEVVPVEEPVQRRATGCAPLQVRGDPRQLGVVEPTQGVVTQLLVAGMDQVRLAHDQPPKSSESPE
jgi:hypothetical protein